MRSERLANQSSHWTTALLNSTYWVALVSVALVHLILSGVLPPTEDELYYWSWAQRLDLSYFDHPPMVAYLIYASTKLFGSSVFSIRLGACLCSTLMLILLARLTPKRSLLTLFLFTPLFLLGSVLMTPDLPLLLFWTCYTLWLIGVNRTLSQWADDPVVRVYRQTPVPLSRWFVGGLWLGLGFLSKYPMLIAVPCALAVLLSKVRTRAWMTGFLFHLGVAFLVALPVVYYNFQHHFLPFFFQWEHSSDTHGISWLRFFDFIGTQILILGALPFLVLPWATLHGRELCEEPDLHVCFYFFVFPLLFFLFHALRSQVEANWPVLAYLTVAPLAQRLLDRTSFKTVAKTVVGIAFLPAFLCSALFFAHSFTPLKIIPIGRDRVAKLKAQYDMSIKVGRDIQALNEPLPVYLPNYQWTAYLRYQRVEAQQIFPSSRLSQYLMEPRGPICSQKTILLFSDTPSAELPLEAIRCFKHSQILREYPFVVRGEQSSKFYLVRYWQ